MKTIFGWWQACPVMVMIIASAVFGQQREQLAVRISWGHRSPGNTPFHVKLMGSEVELADLKGLGLEGGEELRDWTVETRAGGGDVDGAQFTVKYSPMAIKTIQKLNSIWADLIAQSDADTARRLRFDPAYRIDPRRLTVQLDRAGTKGFAMTVDQLLQNKAVWVPALDMFVSVGEPGVSFEQHQSDLEAFKGRRILEQVEREPEASYEQFTARWEDMGSPRYRHPNQPAPGHIVCVGWDSGLYKFGIDRWAGVWPDLGNRDKVRLSYGFDALSWKSQNLADGLPIITTTFEKPPIQYETEQFAYPLDGPPSERRGDIAMVLMQRLRVTNQQAQEAMALVQMTHQRPIGATVLKADGDTFVLTDAQSRAVLLEIEGKDIRVEAQDVPPMDAKQPRRCNVRLSIAIPGNGSRDVIVKLPSPDVAGADVKRLSAIRYAEARGATARFWADYLARGAQFRVPEKVVNDLFKANLWHALRLPRRHGGAGENVKIDLPYSNFAYGQEGTPWPVNQAVYVDYMLYDLRGHHDISAEDLRAMYRNNQEPNGHVGGYANWGVYTPSMIYTVAKNYLLSGDRQALDKMLPQTLEAADWCLAQITRGKGRAGPASGLVEAPLNDGTGNGVWAFNQAYVYAGLDSLATVLKQIGHERAKELADAAAEFRESVHRGFGAATMRSPLVQLRDHTWSPYVPTEALIPGRMMNQWYPTDVDSGAMHLPRLRALLPDDFLTDCLLTDHEDNLFLHGWGMANEPVYNPQATAYLYRDDAKAVIRAFYSMMACAFSHSCLEPVEHRWTWGQYFGPPSTDGAWFELYRNMLIRETEDGALLLLQATPRKWLEEGNSIEVQRAPTYFGPISMKLESSAASGKIVAEITTPARSRPKSLILRLRHPDAKPIQKVSVNGRDWRDYDPKKEWLKIDDPSARGYRIVVEY